MTEVRLELLLGKQVYDRNDQPIGRLQEVKAEERGSDVVVTEYHIGALGLMERLGALVIVRALLRPLGLKQEVSMRIVPWPDIDLSDTDHLRLRDLSAKSEIKS
ncbi:sporulation protein YlmC with PRC-barrel domain [Rhizobium mesoamericanum]|uniref:PRC-barrel domain containing protein n=1 Tax=Rhizobium mesoamericanum TaxID=1079800 RepID=UPI002789B922|nr:PRC-barrel domain containing protein [Rhizobium mesoamericanum]MDQ0562526.1 sporulation protein YlmC with PRC-barrel domain [Rhizobium mesoamericanum]